MTTSFFQNIEAVAVEEVFRKRTEYDRDTNPHKVNLCLGVYRTNEGTPWVLAVVSKAEVLLAADKTLDHEYLNIDGMKEFCTVATKLVLGDDSPAMVDNRVCAFQALSGTGGLRVLLEFTRRFFPTKVVYNSNPTWGNHLKVVRDVGYSDRREYRYFDNKTKALDIDGMLQDLQNAPEGSVIIIQGCAHNPTGVDPSKDQWRKISSLIKEKHLFPLLDYCYQGLVSGDLDTDAWAVRHFVEQGIEMAVAQSFSKNFGLYCDRIGNAFIVTNDAGQVEPIRSQLKAIIRPMWSNPPAHGAHIVRTVFSNPASMGEWKKCIKIMSDRIRFMRGLLLQKMKENGTPGNWEHIVRHCGMFTFTGMTAKQCDFLLDKYHIYTLGNGRINMCALTTNNIDYVANAFDDAVRNIQD